MSARGGRLQNNPLDSFLVFLRFFLLRGSRSCLPSCGLHSGLFSGWLRVFVSCLVSCFVSSPKVLAEDFAPAVPVSLQHRLRVCVQPIDYYPHYDFRLGQGRGFATEWLQAFARAYQYQLELVPLPIKRLYQTRDCDLIYPDNPNWHSDATSRLFSQVVTHILGGTMVRRGDEQRGLAEIKLIGVPRGFTPDHLLALQPNYKFVLVETPDAKSALQMLLKKRVDAVDVEWHVARHLLVELNARDAIVLSHVLPVSTIGFRFSSDTRPDVIDRINHWLEQSTVTAQLQQQYQFLSNPAHVWALQAEDLDKQLAPIQHPAEPTQH